MSVAAGLLGELGSFNAVLAASEARLTQLAGEPAAREIALHRDVLLCAMRSHFASGPVLANWQALLDYLRVDMAPALVEKVRVLHLDAQNHLIRDELIAEGTIDEAVVHVREVIRRALELGSAFLILAHNHPSGSLKPSQADIALTRSLAEAGRLFRITLIDHVIIADNGSVSLRERGIV